MWHVAFHKDPLANAHAKGPSGKVGFPTYMENLHSLFLGVGYTGLNVGTILNTMTSAVTPYNGAAAYDSTADLAANQTRYSTYDALVTALNHQTDWESVVNTARAKLDDTVTYPRVNLVSFDLAPNAISDSLSILTQALANANIVAMSDAFEARATPRFLRGVSRFAAGMADIGAVNSSAFIVGLTLLENDFLQETNKFDAELTHKVYDTVAVPLINANIQAAATQRQQRNVLLSQAVDTMIGSLFNKINSGYQAVVSQADINRLKIQFKEQQLQRDLELDVQDTLWDINAHQLAVNILAGINGAPVVPRGISTEKAVIGGMLSGAGTGAAIGSAVPGIGTVVGAGVGAVLGAAAGFL